MLYAQKIYKFSFFLILMATLKDLNSKRAEIQAHLLEASQSDVSKIIEYCRQYNIPKCDRIALDIMHTHYRTTSKLPDESKIDEMFSDVNLSELEAETASSDMWDKAETRLRQDIEYRKRMFQQYQAMVKEILD